MSRLPRNTHEGKFIATVTALGCVPPCVRDAFSWLPHPVIQIGRERKARLVWFWLIGGAQEPVFTPKAPPPEIERPTSGRCNHCIFQEPPWSQGYAGCSHSWLRDDDGDCRAFVDRQEFLAIHPSYADFCWSPMHADIGEDMLTQYPYRRDSTRYVDYGPTYNLPSGYYARLNMPEWVAAGAEKVYAAIDRERLRRFWQWAADETVKRVGAFQYDMFLHLPGV